MSVNLSTKLITEIKNIAEKYSVNKIVLFGSRARGDNNLRSDIDLAVYPSPEFVQKGYFTSDIDDLDTLLKIDVVFIDSSTAQNLIQNIDREGVTIYERL